MKLLRQSLAAALFLLPLPAAADEGLCALAALLDQEVVAATGLPPASTCPDIGFDIPVQAGLARSQAGAYDPATGAIDLAPDLDLTSAIGRSYLLHELVHAAQYRAGLQDKAPCPAALEEEAYRVQADYLQRQGFARDAVLIRMFAGPAWHLRGG